MKSWPDINGRFGERLYFETHEFDQMMDNHSALFIEDIETMSLFPEDEAIEKEEILCREGSVEDYDKRRYRGEWWEYQANQCMAALLLPRELFREKVDSAVESMSAMSFNEAVRRAAVRR